MQQHGDQAKIQKQIQEMLQTAGLQSPAGHPVALLLSLQWGFPNLVFISVTHYTDTLHSQNSLKASDFKMLQNINFFWFVKQW